MTGITHVIFGFEGVILFLKLSMPGQLLFVLCSDLLELLLDDSLRTTVIRLSLKPKACEITYLSLFELPLLLEARPQVKLQQVTLRPHQLVLQADVFLGGSLLFLERSLLALGDPQLVESVSAFALHLF